MTAAAEPHLFQDRVRYADTDAGGVVVRLKEGCVEVEDSGIGMDAATLARAFEPFYRGEGEQYSDESTRRCC